ncbi:MAG: aldehyde ferredoxin oxidoreductase C-terminal domain-containing protein [Candidatus Freyrarchaeum guaymaensis]
MECYGYMGKTLFVDLSSGDIREEPLDANLVKKFVGGPGIGYRILFDMLKPGTDPLSPENPIVVGTGPLLGTLTPGAGKCYLAMKYPIPASKRQKKYFVSIAMGGSRRFGVMLKNAGYDHLVITGRAEKPSYLLVTDEEVRICDAKDIWGKDVHETNNILLKKHRGKTGKCGTWTIGQAGENLVRISQATLDNLNSLGRHVGASLGSKNLKAVVTLGRKGIRVKDKKRFMKLYKKKLKEILDHPRYQPLPPATILGGEATGQLYERTRGSIKACTGCLGACRATLEVKEGRFKGATYQGGDFTISVDYARRLRIKEYGDMYKLMDLMNRYGLCMLTTIRMMYFVTRMYEQGVVTKEDTGGLELKLGDVDTYIALIEKIVKREDIGAVMAEGWYPLSEELCVDASAEFRYGCSIVKGVDTLIDARLWKSHFSPAMGFTNVVHSKGKHVHGATYWPRGPDLLKDTYWPEMLQSLGDIKRDTLRMGVTEEEMNRIFTENSFNTGRLAKYTQDAEYLYNALGLCDCVVHWECDPTRNVPWLAELYTATTGIEVEPREFLRVGERIWNLERLLNVREGFTREDDEVPAVWLQNTEIPLKLRSGDSYLVDWFGNRLTKEDIKRMLDDYYQERGWDVEKGVPTREKLIELELEEFT